MNMDMSELKRALVEVKKICADSECCNCPFAGKDTTNTGVVICRLCSDEWEMFTPLCWEVDEWKMEGGLNVDEWISIRDALPGLHENVLFTPMCNKGAIYIGELNAVGEHGTAYFAVRSGRRKTCYSATHWMRLPELPKEE